MNRPKSAYNFAWKNTTMYSPVATRPTGQHQMFCRTVR